MTTAPERNETLAAWGGPPTICLAVLAFNLLSFLTPWRGSETCLELWRAALVGEMMALAQLVNLSTAKPLARFVALAALPFAVPGTMAIVVPGGSDYFEMIVELSIAVVAPTFALRYRGLRLSAAKLGAESEGIRSRQFTLSQLIVGLTACAALFGLARISHSLEFRHALELAVLLVASLSTFWLVFARLAPRWRITMFGAVVFWPLGVETLLNRGGANLFLRGYWFSTFYAGVAIAALAVLGVARAIGYRTVWIRQVVADVEGRGARDLDSASHGAAAS